MSDEVERLRRVFEELEEQNKGVLGWACMALGIDRERTSAEWDDHVLMGKLYKPYSIDQLCERVEYLIENERILSGVVIGGLLTQLVDMFDYMGDPNKIPDSIDNNMDMLKNLERMREIPLQRHAAECANHHPLSRSQQQPTDAIGTDHSQGRSETMAKAVPESSCHA